ncbi:MAG: chemotaxis protein CheW [Acidobacteria bacterium]|nr:chemotaxis protein CheW [Acidobacteriota bacterium]
MDETQEIIEEFLIESNENLTQLDQDFIKLEQQPDDNALLSSVFRTIHTIKGTGGVLGFGILEAITHRAESILSQLREGERRLTPALTTLLLETVDIVKKILREIEASGNEGSERYLDLVERLQAVCDDKSGAEAVAPEQASAGNPGGLERSYPPASEPVEEVAAEGDEHPHFARQPDSASPAEGEQGEPPAAVPAATRSSVTDANIRVSVDLLDKLMNLVGELVLTRNQILQYTDTQEDAAFTATSQRLNLITTELQANVMKTRMQPIRVVWNQFPRVVRDLGQAFGKQLELQMDGANTELDKTIIEAIKDPLTHIVRNSCDHGIEMPEVRAAAGKPSKGTVLLRAFHEGGQVNIEISDDGAGINPDKLKQKAVQNGILTLDQAERLSQREALDLTFLPGLSTAKQVTNVSGRGVGMDVVKTNIEKIGGSIDLQSRLGHGTTLKIKIPLTLAIIPALVIECAGERFAIPQVNLVELVRLETGQEGQQQIELIGDTPVYRLRGKLLPLVYLSDVLGLDGSHETGESVNIIVLQADQKTFGLVVDAVHDTAEIVVKPLSKLLKGLNCYAGATIMGDGHVALILDVMGLAQLGGVVGESASHVQSAADSRDAGAAEKQAVLLFRAGAKDRLAVPLALVDRLEEFGVEAIELSGERQVVQYRERILPLMPLGSYLSGTEGDAASDEKVQVIVFSEGTKRIGIVVDEILDIVDEAITIRSRSSQPGILGSAVVGGQVTDFIDLHYLIEEASGDWFGGKSGAAAEGAHILVTEGSRFTRGLMRTHLEMAGYRVHEAANSEEAMECLRSETVDVLVSSLDLPGESGGQLLTRVRGLPDVGKVPALGLSLSAEELSRRPETGPAFDEYQLKFDRAAMLHSIEKLASAVLERKPETVGTGADV